MDFPLFSANEEKVVDLFMEIKRRSAGWNRKEDSIDERPDVVQGQYCRFQNQRGQSKITELYAGV